MMTDMMIMMRLLKFVSMCDALKIENICNYHDITSYGSAIPVSCATYLNITQLNARSLNKNYDHLFSLLKFLPKLPDVSCISETWLKTLNKLEDLDSIIQA